MRAVRTGSSQGHGEKRESPKWRVAERRNRETDNPVLRWGRSGVSPRSSDKWTVNTGVNTPDAHEGR